MVIGGILITISDTWSLVMFAISFCNVSSNQVGNYTCQWYTAILWNVEEDWNAGYFNFCFSLKFMHNWSYHKDI